ncbi:Hypothetical protein GbCGDNIH2_1443 [Granulibacter bethesdensis]|uniref:Uncharacterized protein n=1 Tax=Granulibacter bethesdensis (strain ATCC BAA-1260 / CGDNIH1) TaxID=391165 RepID=Q0BS61_GRABC|nr:hypothetical protein [Granulibacter bethesdensis]ABI62341.1 Hypothetical protein GbCGDNIH1_1443 [Granulibacter bethesdensis CGDNIH1]APG30673.1 Hypothetical protein GbCGDNIH2_1443 [Granulibacter bethesdensis]APH52170.1 Hypothetical protein GbCGDNIH5_1443 [Granulibacter bethesdensis]APH64863.1 Hypothetical protein GbCGDNIH1I4_1443 [Granulibacter bethesdensis]
MIACSILSGLHYSDVASRMPELPSGQSPIWVYGSTGSIAMAIQPEILIDNKLVGAAMTGSTFCADILPGQIRYLKYIT